MGLESFHSSVEGGDLRRASVRIGDGKGFTVCLAAYNSEKPTNNEINGWHDTT